MGISLQRFKNPFMLIIILQSNKEFLNFYKQKLSKAGVPPSENPSSTYLIVSTVIAVQCK